MRGELDAPDFFLGDEDNPYPNQWLVGDQNADDDSDDDSDSDDEPSQPPDKYYRRDESRDSRIRNIMNDVVKAGSSSSSNNNSSSSNNGAQRE